MSFVEKALNRLKRESQEVTPLGEFRDPADGHPPAAGVAGVAGAAGAADATGATGATGAAGAAGTAGRYTAGETPAEPRAARGKMVAVDRARMREAGFLAPEKYQRQMADEYRRIKRPLIANAFGIGVPRIEDGNLILVSSAVSGEGKTHTCINLALSLATERDRTVLLVDGDVPKPHISRLFGLAEQPGLLDALGEKSPPLDELLIRTDIPRLSVLPAGRWKDDATELLASGQMRALCSELARRYSDRIILFDSPPLLAATEAQAIAAVVGQVVLVIAENITARDDVRAAFALLDDNKPINVILNKSRQPSTGGYYYGGYGFGATAGAAPDEEPAER